MTECASVASALGVVLPVSIDQRLAGAIAVGDHRTSMLQDRLAGKPLEIDCLTGAVAEIAGRAGVDVPQTRAVHDLVTALGDLGYPAAGFILELGGIRCTTAQAPGCAQPD